MTRKKTDQNQLTDPEIKVIKQLRQNPEMMARFQSILDLTGQAGGPMKTADEVEELPIQERRRLGHASMNQWTLQAEERAGQELKEQNPTLRSRKKNVEVELCLWAGGGAGSDLAKWRPELYPSVARTAGSSLARTLSPAGTGVDRLWLRAFFCPVRRECP